MRETEGGNMGESALACRGGSSMGRKSRRIFSMLASSKLTFCHDSGGGANGTGSDYVKT